MQPEERHAPFCCSPPCSHLLCTKKSALQTAVSLAELLGCICDLSWGPASDCWQPDPNCPPRVLVTLHSSLHWPAKCSGPERTGRGWLPGSESRSAIAWKSRSVVQGFPPLLGLEVPPAALGWKCTRGEGRRDGKARAEARVYAGEGVWAELLSVWRWPGRGKAWRGNDSCLCIVEDGREL